MADSIAKHLATQGNRQRERAQASARPARTRFTVATVGVGEHRLVGSTALDFGAFMLEEPTFSYGLIAAEPLGLGLLPLGTATVLTFLKNTQGNMWTGAEIGFYVQCSKPDVRLRWSLTFEASSMRSTFGTGTGTLGANQTLNATTPNTGSTLS